MRSRESDPKRGSLTFNSGAEDQIDSVVAFVGINPNHRRKLARKGFPFSWHGSLRAFGILPTSMLFTSTININFAKARRDLSKEPTRRCPHGWYSGCKLGMLEDSPRIDISGELHESVIRHLAIAALVA